MKLARYIKLAIVAMLIAVIAAPAFAARDKKEEKKEPLYPNATREDPGVKQSRRLQKKLMSMYELSQEDDADKTIAAAEEVLNSSMAGKYEKSLAAQTLAYAYIDKDDYARALPYLEQALQEEGLANDQHFQIMYQVAQLHLQAAQEAEDEAGEKASYAKSLEWFDRFFKESGSQKAEHLAMKGNALYRLERYPEAIEALKTAIANTDEPQSSWLQLLMGAYFETDQQDEAAKIAEGLLAKNPEDKALIRNLASIYINADLNDKAIAVLEGAKARGLLTDDKDYTQLYQLYHYAEKETQAIATINEGLEKGILKPSLDVYRALAEANYFAEQIPAAIDAYKKAAPLADNGDVSLNLARLLTEEERWAEAKAAVNDAIAKGLKRTGDAYIILGAAEFGLDNEKGAIEAYRKAATYPETKTVAETWLRQSGLMK